MSSRLVGSVLVSGLAVIAQSLPAHALGGSVQISQAGGVTTVAVQGATITSASGNLGPVLPPLNFSFTISSSATVIPAVWVDLPPPTYAYGASGGGDGANIYTGLTGSIFSSSLIPVNTSAASLEVDRGGNLSFLIGSTVDSAPNCFTGVGIVGATSGSPCGSFLKNLTLNISTGKTGFVPDADPGTIVGPSLSALLANFTGTYNGTGSLQSGGGEGLLSFNVQQQVPVPGPLPVLGAGAAFAYSRRLRQRIVRSRGSSSVDR